MFDCNDATSTHSWRNETLVGFENDRFQKKLFQKWTSFYVQHLNQYWKWSYWKGGCDGGRLGKNWKSTGICMHRQDMRHVRTSAETDTTRVRSYHWPKVAFTIVIILYRHVAVAKGSKHVTSNHQQLTLTQMQQAQIVVGTSCMGTGVDSESVRNVIVVGLPYSVEQFLQWSGRCRGNGMISTIMQSFQLREATDLSSEYIEHCFWHAANEQVIVRVCGMSFNYFNVVCQFIQHDLLDVHV